MYWRRSKISDMKQYGLIGGEIANSLSPQIHNLIYRRFGIAAQYQLLPTTALLDRVAELRAAGVAGFNVTMPYKRAIIPLLDDLTPRARLIDSVNTVVLRNGKYVGDNSDSQGFGEALAHNRIALANKIVLINGAGGAASAVIDHLIDVGAKMILIYNRTRAHTNQLMIRVKQTYRWQNVMSVFDYHGLVVDAIVNATPLGGSGHSDSAALDLNVITTSLYIDLIYRPLVTETMQIGQARGIKTLGGLDMLVYQALQANALWHDISYDATDAKEIIDHVKALL